MISLHFGVHLWFYDLASEHMWTWTITHTFTYKQNTNTKHEWKRWDEKMKIDERPSSWNLIWTSLLSYRFWWDAFVHTQLKWSKNFHLTGYQIQNHTIFWMGTEEKVLKCYVYVFVVRLQTLQCSNIGFVCLWYICVAHVSITT